MVLALALGGRVYMPQAVDAQPAVHAADMIDFAMATAAQSMTGDCDARGPGESATPACGVVCVGPSFVLSTVALATVMPQSAVHALPIGQRFSGSTPGPDPHPPRLNILA